VLTIGPVPILYNSKDLDITIPIVSDNLFIYHFFIQLLLNIKTQVEYEKFSFLLKNYLYFKTKLF
jgi:hypothetical protein